MIIKTQKEKISRLKTENEEFRTKISEQQQEISVLKRDLQHAEDLTKCRETFEGKLELKVQETKSVLKDSFMAECHMFHKINHDINNQINNINKTIYENSKKIDGKLELKNKTIPEQKPHENPVKTAEVIKPQNTSETLSNLDEHTKRKLIIKTEEKEKVVTVTNEKVKIHTKIVLLMDSNRKFNKPKDLLLGSGDKLSTIIKTSTAAEIMGIINVLDLSQTQHIILSTGTNDTDDTEVGEIVHLIVDAAEQIHNMYPDMNIYVSELLPRKELAQRETAQINKKLVEILPPTIHRITHSNLNSRHMHDDKHVLRKYVQLVIDNISKKLTETTGFEKDVPEQDEYYDDGYYYRHNKNSHNNRWYREDDEDYRGQHGNKNNNGYKPSNGKYRRQYDDDYAERDVGGQGGSKRSSYRGDDRSRRQEEQKGNYRKPPPPSKTQSNPNIRIISELMESLLNRH